jgi:hypothetical protein
VYGEAVSSPPLPRLALWILTGYLDEACGELPASPYIKNYSTPLQSLRDMRQNSLA